VACLVIHEAWSVEMDLFSKIFQSHFLSAFEVFFEFSRVIFVEDFVYVMLHVFVCQFAPSLKTLG